MREKHKENGLGINTKPAPIKVPLRLIQKQNSLWLSFHYLRVILPLEPCLSSRRTMLGVVFVNILVKGDIDRNEEETKLHFPVPCRFCRNFSLLTLLYCCVSNTYSVGSVWHYLLSEFEVGISLIETFFSFFLALHVSRLLLMH